MSSWSTAGQFSVFKEFLSRAEFTSALQTCGLSPHRLLSDVLWYTHRDHGKCKCATRHDLRPWLFPWRWTEMSDLLSKVLFWTVLNGMDIGNICRIYSLQNITEMIMMVNTVKLYTAYVILTLNPQVRILMTSTSACLTLQIATNKPKLFSLFRKSLWNSAEETL